MHPPSPSRQIAFHQLLLAARKQWLVGALSECLGAIDPTELKRQLVQYTPRDALRILAASGVRDEHVFPTPIVLEAKPTLVGYYRLLLGISQKSFYAAGTGFGRLKSMEARGTINDVQRATLPEFCRAMGQSLAELVRQLSPVVTQQDISELPLLTLGSQFQGANNVMIGQTAINDVYLIIAEIVQGFIKDRRDRKLVLENASKRRVEILLAADPDIRVLEEFDGILRNKVAIEVKGGTDRSNAHNRAGEAEKSHRKAHSQEFRDFWTVIAMKGLDRKRLKQESPTTRSWFDVAEILARTGPDWDEFRSRFSEIVGIPVS